MFQQTSRRESAGCRSDRSFMFIPWYQNYKIQSIFTCDFDVQFKISENRNDLNERLHVIALWRHGNGTWLNDLFLTTASSVNCSGEFANHVT